MNQSAVIRDNEEGLEEEAQEDDEMPSSSVLDHPVNSYRYDPNSFVAVKTEDNQNDCPFWIAKVNVVHRNEEDSIYKLTIHWFDTTGKQDMYHSKYFPSYNNINSKKVSKRTPMKDTISVDTVIVNFSSLTKKHQLPASVAQHLRSI